MSVSVGVCGVEGVWVSVVVSVWCSIMVVDVLRISFSITLATVDHLRWVGYIWALVSVSRNGSGVWVSSNSGGCLLYTSDAADE